MKNTLINNDLFLENIKDYETKDLDYVTLPDSVGLYSRCENNKRIYIVFFTDEFGGIEYTKDYNNFDEAIKEARDLYISLMDYSLKKGQGY